jgi:hypothetical protein
MSTSENKFMEAVKNVHLSKSFTEADIHKASASKYQVHAMGKM